MNLTFAPNDRIRRVLATRRMLPALVASGTLLVACTSSADGAPEESLVAAPTDTSVEMAVTTEAPPATDPAPATAPPTSPTSEPAPTTTAPAPPPVTTAAPAPPPVTTAPPAAPPVTNAPTGAACLVGRWTISDVTLAAYFDAVEVNSGFDSIDGSGVIHLNFGDTSYEWVNDYRLAMVIDDVLYESVQAGGFAGAYTASDGVITGSIDDEFRTGTITRDGTPLTEDVGDLFVGINPARPMDMLSYSCDGPAIVLEAGPRADSLFRLELEPA